MTDFRFPVEASQVLAFARAIGDENPAYTDPSSREAVELGAIPAPPTFAMSAAHFEPDYPLRPRQGRPWPESADAGEAHWLHAEQHFEYRRPMVVGDVLDVVQRPGRTWDKASRGGGTLRFEELVTEYRDTRTGEQVVVARFVRVLPVTSGEGE
ncbi:MaoC family dehydratase N-terminal domain-containing protein [Pseudonocardia kujensis]|uniref:FAS1-like dehydratase domain-containing protein n=1 Tax=Pseudonocardia kujensis TaxID=1128675 RepID=UPI001E5A24DE|nr:MaoC family dehydratase N-terminal domain-containing protein [Pseudonocardia kujensis]MCE0765969.1 MaoC family dehydratase N-terminal domain-containing protein [Pseudonocardia kujensis]